MNRIFPFVLSSILCGCPLSLGDIETAPDGHVPEISDVPNDTSVEDGGSEATDVAMDLPDIASGDYGTSNDATLSIDVSSSCEVKSFYLDDDGDGFGDPGNPFSGCEAPEHYVANNDDCDDTDPQVNPEGRELVPYGNGECFEDFCNDGKDNDCNRSMDQAEWQCQDDDGDGIPNGVDAINVINIGALTMVCVERSSVFPSDLQSQGVFLQGHPSEILGGFSALSPIGVACDGDFPGCCFDATGLPDRVYTFTFISHLGLDGNEVGSDCNNWHRMDMSLYCETCGDPLCRNYQGSDDCGNTVGYVVNVPKVDGVFLNQ